MSSLRVGAERASAAQCGDQTKTGGTLKQQGIPSNQWRHLMSHSSWASKATDSLILRASVIKAMRRALLASAVASSFAFVSHEASAQQQATEAAAEETPVLQEVVGTGSLIKRPAAET